MTNRAAAVISIVVGVWLSQGASAAPTARGPEANDPLTLVNPFVGTGGHGHTFPGATVPFGMVQLSPDTRVEGWDACGGYYRADSAILGFSHTHLSGTGIADYGDILVTPYNGAMDSAGGYHPLKFRHVDEEASPGFYKVRFPAERIGAELTATERTGIHRYTFDGTSQRGVIINLLHGLGPDRVIDSWVKRTGAREISGMRRSAGWAADQTIYFVARFSVPLERVSLFGDDVQAQGDSAGGTNLKCLVRFGGGQHTVMMKVGMSSVSAEGALRNLNAEAGGWSFDRYRSAAAAKWKRELGRIAVSGGTPEQQKTFYSALYHTMIAPNIYSDVDGRYRGMDGAIHTAAGYTMYTVFSLWDTFRGEHPLMTILDPGRARDFVKSLLARYDESGTLPVWELSANETWCMIGYHAVPVIADAILKGIGGFDERHALEAMIKSADADRYGLTWFRESGFVPAERDAESVSKTLEYAYDDWCIARAAEHLGRTDVAARFDRRAASYRNLFDPSTGFMRPRMNGAWDSPFDPAAVTNNYTEANPWQYSFFVPHDIGGLAALHGGASGMNAKLDTLFEGSSEMTGREQADITGLIGRYAQGNEPSHHAAYLYDLTGQPWKTQRLIKTIVDSLYTPAPDGLCGNDDCGQMSAWYVLSALGFYPVNPAGGTYAIGSPLFEKAIIHLNAGKQFTVSVRRNERGSEYIHSATLNGSTLAGPTLHHADIMNGGIVNFMMGSNPSERWGAKVTVSASESFRAIPVTPIINAPAKAFADSMTVSITAISPDCVIHYTVDGSAPDAGSARYAGPFAITATSNIRAVAVGANQTASGIASATFTRSVWKGALTLHSIYAQQYSGGGPNALIDGVFGETDFRLGAWQGYEETDLNAVLDLGSMKAIDSVGLRCLQDNNSWIFFPTEVTFSFSADGVTYADSVEIRNPISPRELTPMIREFAVVMTGRTARFIRIHGSNIGHCPPWHKGARGKAWLFTDELLVKTR